MESRISPMNQQPAEKVVTEIALLLQQAIVGYRFHPTDEELINYLKSKVTGCRETFCIIPTLENIYEINPWDLPAKFDGRFFTTSKEVPQKMNRSPLTRDSKGFFMWVQRTRSFDPKIKNGGSYVHRRRTNGLAGRHHVAFLGRLPVNI